MRKAIGLMLAAGIGCLLLVPSLWGRAQAAESVSAEEKAFRSVEECMGKTRQGGENPSESDYSARRAAALDMVAKAKAFLLEFPNSKEAENAQALINIGLYEASLTGEAAAGEELHTRATRMVEDSKIPNSLKLHAFLVDYLARWAKKHGQRNLNQGSPEVQSIYMDGLFAAADVLPDKDEIFKMILLQAKSAREGTDPKALAQRVQKHPGASPTIVSEAGKILSGEQAYALGKPLDLRFTAVDGTKVNLSQMKGKVVLVDFWATWCGPCVAEVPEVKKVYDTYHAKGFEILGISLDEKKDELLEFIKKHQMPWPQYFDGKHWNNEISFRFGINGVPTMWLVDQKGLLRTTEARGTLEQTVKAMLEEK